MGIRMLHRRRAHARVHATATADTRLAPGTAPWRRPRPALAPGAATPRIPRAPVTALHTTVAGLRRPFARLVPRFVLRFVPRGDTWRLWAETVRGCLALVLGVLGRLHRPRTARRIPVIPAVPVPVVAATARPLSERPDGSAPR
ncbi:hypothetical protein [Streptomyces sp. NBC_01235]|uniref:hypothetical protein n=1 Tax=Streptomyces sp. NBC_01235 TaxID=2903788 RepID=UPI002E11BFCF|nr:hypothetical protein OG289_14120 [Streptomyces sp. NBC_01235]